MKLDQYTQLFFFHSNLFCPHTWPAMISHFLEFLLHIFVQEQIIFERDHQCELSARKYIVISARVETPVPFSGHCLRTEFIEKTSGIFGDC